MHIRLRSCRYRQGSATVEFAIILPIVLLVFFGTLEIGRAMTVKHSLQEAARAGCRMAVLEGSTNEDIEILSDASLDPAGINTYTLTVNPTDFQAAEEGDAVTVTISADPADVGWFAPLILSDSLAGSCTMRIARRPEVDWPEPAPDQGKKAAKKVAKKVGKKEAKKVGKKANKKTQPLSWKKN
jgi:Flp pilus assembly protein TadG